MFEEIAYLITARLNAFYCYLKIGNSCGTSLKKDALNSMNLALRDRLFTTKILLYSIHELRDSFALSHFLLASFA